MEHISEASLFPSSSVLKFQFGIQQQECSPPHNCYFGITLATDIGDLEERARRLLHRYEILTARIVHRENELFIAVADDPEAGPILRTGFDHHGLQTYIHSLSRIEAQDPFLLTIIFNDAPDGRRSVVFVHHPALIDHHSQMLLLAELALENKREGDEPLQFTDYVAWLKDYETGEKSKAVKKYWSGHRHLFGASLAHPKAVGSSGFFNACTRLPATDGVDDAEAFFLSAFYVLLQKYFQSNEIGVLVETFARPFGVSEHAVGNFYNAFPVFQAINPQDNFASLQTTIRSLAEQYIRQFYLSLPLIAGEMQMPAGELSDFKFTYLSKSEARHIPGHDLLMQAPSYPTGQKLELRVEETNDGHRVTIRVDGRYFDQAQAEALLAYLLRIAEKAHENPLIGSIEILSDAEKRRILDDFNDTAFDYGFERPVNLQFEYVAAASPSHIAVVDKRGRWSYQELNALSNRLAHTLLRIGACKNAFVAVHLDRSALHLASMLAIFKSGGLYLPLSLKNPAERTLFYLRDSDAVVLITDSESLAALGNELPESLKGIICLSGEKPDQLAAVTKPVRYPHHIDQQPSYNPPNMNGMRDWAFMIYTSGSTGAPKGAILRHDGLFNQIFSKITTFGLDPEFSMLQSAPVSSDIAVWQFLGAVCFHGTVVIGEEDAVNVPDKLHALIASEHVSLVELVPTVADVLADYVNDLPRELRKLEAFRVLMICGEDFHKNLVNKCLRMTQALTIYNAYGPAEASDDVTLFRVSREIPAGVEKVSIGKPVQNMKIYIMDQEGALLPVGVAGEICMAGVGVGAGYWKNAELTARKFVDNIYSTDERDRIVYRSGDLGRWLPDGSLEFLGRIDSQVKINGNRIEIGEVENHILRFEKIRKVAVVFIIHNQVRQLAAFYVPHSPMHVDELKDFLGRHLPVYMIPSWFIETDDFPISMNGKVDRKKLQAKALEIVSRKTDGPAPENATEELLLLLWKNILRTSDISVTDNFFELGGNSLKAMLLQSQIFKATGRDITISTFFKTPTIRDIAACIAAISSSEMPGITAIEEQEYYELSHAQKRLWVLNMFEEEKASYNMPYSFALEGLLDLALLQRSFESLLERHEILRTEIVEVNGEPRQRVVPFTAIRFDIEYIDLLGDPDGEAKALDLFIRDAHAPFDLRQCPLMRAKVARVAADRYRLHLNVHHIVSDGWSENIIHGELMQVYAALFAGTVPQLPALKFHYKDYATWHNRLVSNELSASRKFWSACFKEPFSPLPLPLDFPRPAEKTFRGGRRGFFIDQQITDTITTLCRQRGVTVYMALVAAVKAFLFRYTNHEDVIIGSPTAGRPHPDLENQIGFYVNTLALRTRITAADSFLSVLDRVRINTLQAFEHQLYPFDLLVEDLNLPRDLSRSPVFDVFVALQNTSSLREADKTAPIQLEISEEEVDFATSKFDLSYYFEEKQQGIGAGVEFNTSLFLPSTIERLNTNFLYLLQNMLGAPDQPLASIPFPAEEERTRITRLSIPEPCEFPAHARLDGLFEEKARLMPDAVAVTCTNTSLTYGELSAEVDRLAWFLSTVNRSGNALIGLYLDRHIYLPAAIMAVLRSGYAYVPIDTGFPANRVATIIADTGISTIISVSRFQPLLENIQMTCKRLDHLVFLDDAPTAAFNSEEQATRDLWNDFSTRPSEYEKSGWIDPRTLQAYRGNEMCEFYGNVSHKLKDIVQPEMRVLEIGCGNGITAFTTAPLVSAYLATDISDGIIDHCRQKAAKEKISGLEFRQLPASGVSTLEGPFDLIIMNSILQYFPSVQYLTELLISCVAKLAPDGFIFIGDIKDADLKQELARFIGKENAEDDELSFSRDFFRDIFSRLNLTVQFSHKQGEIRNDLHLFRYDLVASAGAANNTDHAHVPAKRHYYRRDIVQATPGQPVHAVQNDYAYVIFTSGSTGKPKGVAISHRAVVNFTYSMQGHLGISAEDRFLALTAYTFDISVLELIMPLMLGAAVVIVPEKLTRRPDEIAKIIERSGVTIMQGTPSTYRMMVDEAWEGASNLKILCGGEKLDRELGLKLMQLSDQLWNVYGPTETTIWSTIQKITEPEDLQYIGAPLANTQLFILDQTKQCVPLGVKGLLYIGGEGVAAGYMNRPELTADRFIRHPEFGLIYNTGDLCRRDGDGGLVYLGRADSQVKVMGYRIELGEIEKHLMDSKLSSVVVVLCREANDGNLYLAAFFDHGDTVALKAYAKANLPFYMVPSTWTRVHQWPLNTSGKIDRLKLAERGYGDPPAEALVPPANDLEAQILSIWKSVLRSDHIGVTDNFFASGGNSLKAIKFVSRARKELQIDVELKSLFDGATVRSIASRSTTAQDDDLILPLNEQRETYPASHAQRRFYAARLSSALDQFYNITQVLPFETELSEPAVRESLDALVDEYEILRTVFYLKKGNLVQRVCDVDRSNYLYRYVDLAGSGKDLLATLHEESTIQFDLRSGPLMKVVLIRERSNKYSLLLVLHHIIADAQSLSVLARQLITYYEAVRLGHKVRSKLKFQFRDYACWENKFLLGSRALRMRDFWISHLHAPSRRRLFDGYAYQGEIRSVTIEFTQTLYDQIRSLSSDCQVSVYTTLLSCVKATVCKISGQGEIVVGGPVSTRVMPDLENQIGPFINTIAMRSTIADTTFRELLREVNATVASGLQNALYPFDLLVEDLNDSTGRNQDPVFDIGFAYYDLEVEMKDDVVFEKIVTDASITPLWFDAVLQAQGIRFRIRYADRSLMGFGVDEIAAALLHVAGQLLDNPGMRVSDVKAGDRIRADVHEINISLDI